MSLVLATIDESTHLLDQTSHVTRVADIYFAASRQHGLLVKHRTSAVKDQQPPIAPPLRIGRKTVESTVLTKLCVGRPVWESCIRSDVGHVDTFAL